eukprot:gene15080-17853_t
MRRSTFTFCWWEGSKVSNQVLKDLHENIPFAIQKLVQLIDIENIHQICMSYKNDLTFYRHFENSKFSTRDYLDSLPALKSSQWYMFAYNKENKVTSQLGNTIPTLQTSFDNNHSNVVLYRRNEEEYYFIIWEGNRTRPIEKSKFPAFASFVFLIAKEYHKKIKIVKFSPTADFEELSVVLRSNNSSPYPNQIITLPSPKNNQATPEIRETAWGGTIRSRGTTPKPLSPMAPLSALSSHQHLMSSPGGSVCSEDEGSIIVCNVKYTGYDMINQAIDDFNAGTLRWILIGYMTNSKQTLGLLGKGTRGMSEMIKLLREDITAFGLMRITYIDKRPNMAKEQSLQKTMFIQWLGTKSNTLEKARRNSHIKPVYRMFQEKTIVHGELEADNHEDLSDSSILQKLTSFRNDIQYKQIVEA